MPSTAPSNGESSICLQILALLPSILPVILKPETNNIFFFVIVSNHETASNTDQTSNNSWIEDRPPSQSSATNYNDLHQKLNENGRTSSSLAPRDNRGLPPRRLNLNNEQKKRVIEVDYTISCIEKRLSEAKREDKHDGFGRNLAHKLLPNKQRIFAEKLINDAIFEAELGNLNRNCCIHVPTSTSSNIIAVNPCTSLMPLNTPEISTENISCESSIYIPPTQSVAFKENIVLNYDSNDRTISQYIANYRP